MIMLSILMFNASLGLKCSDVKDLMQKKYLLLAGLAATLIIPIIYIYGMTIAMRLWYEPFEVQYILVGLALSPPCRSQAHLLHGRKTPTGI